MPRRLGQRFGHLGEEAVEDEEHVEGQLLLAQPGRTTHVDKHGDERLFAPLDAAGSVGVARAHARRQQGNDPEVGRGSDLARESHARLGADPRERLGLGPFRRRQAVARDADVAQRFEDRLAQRRDHHATIGERDAEDPEAVAVEPPRFAGHEDERDERHEHPDAHRLKPLEPRDGLGWRRGEIGEHRGEVFRLLGPFADRHAHACETQEREDRDDDRHRIKDRKEARIPGPVAKPK